jgi:uncharacterized membrane protein YdjX (TVP38/TMEM64 family)
MDTTHPSHSEKFHKKTLFAQRKEFIRGAIGAGILFVAIYVLARFIGIEYIRGLVQKSGPFGPLIFILAKISTIVVAPLGGSFLYLLAGPLFGFWKGVAFILAGDIIGGTTAFFLSRRFGRKVLHYFLSEHGMEYIDDILYHMGTWKGFVVTRIIFIGMYDVVSYAAGLSTLSYAHYLIITVVMSTPPFMALVWAGSALVDKGAIATVMLIAGAIATAAAAIVGVRVVRKKKAR